MMKINSEVSLAAAEYRRLGIPVFVAFPCAASVFDFARDVQFLWFALRGSGEEEDTVVQVGSRMPPWLEGPLTDRQVCETIVRESTVIGWEEAVKAIRHVRQSAPDCGRWPFASAYKPVYFLAWASTEVSP